MGEKEDRIRLDIEKKYGSIPKMAAQTGIAVNTIYHALERGIDNTTTRTRARILESLYDAPTVDSASTRLPEFPLSIAEYELLAIYNKLDERGKRQLSAIARAMME